MKNIKRILMGLCILFMLPAPVFAWTYLLGISWHNYLQGFTAFGMLAVGGIRFWGLTEWNPKE